MAREPAIARARVFGAVVSVALLGATLSVLARDPAAAGTDGYPLSTFPMFAAHRETLMTMTYPVGETPTGRVFLTPSLVGSREVLQAKALVDRAVSGGPRDRDALCRRLAARVAADDDFTTVTAISILSGKHDAVDYLVRGQHGTERVLATCPVTRGGSR